MITAVALCPHPPLLFRELSGRADVVAPLREACLNAVEFVTRTSVERVVIVGGADDSRVWDPRLKPDVRRFGSTGTRETTGLPLSLGVGTRLLEGAGWRGPVDLVSIAWDASDEQVRRSADQVSAGEEPIALLVLGDGSARRGERAPGYLDERAFAFDAATGRALATGDVQALLGMDRELADELMVGGRAAFQVMATVVHREAGSHTAKVFYQDDPFGVMYYVTTWT